MRAEHFTEQEIRQKCKDWFSKNEVLMNKYMLRWRMRQTEKRIVPQVWNRWRQFTAMRKLVKYQMK
jgi:hypothetical protein